MPELLSAVPVLHTVIDGSEVVVAAIDCPGEVSHSLFPVSTRQLSAMRRFTRNWLLLSAIICSATGTLVWGLSSSIALTRRVVVHRGEGRSARFASASLNTIDGSTSWSSENDYDRGWLQSSFPRRCSTFDTSVWGCV